MFDEYNDYFLDEKDGRDKLCHEVYENIRAALMRLGVY